MRGFVAMTIPGGFILQPRKIDDSTLMHETPCTRELWFYLLRKVNFADGSNLKRGQGFFRYADIMDDLCWYVGYRKQSYSKTQIAKSLRRLRERNTITTTKTTRGMIVTVLNYNTYQDPKSYEDNNEDSTKETRRQQEDHTISKERKERKEKNKYSCAFDSFWSAYPKKKSKDSAWKAWNQRKADIPDNIVEIVEANKSSNPDWLKNGGQFIPYPGTWLRAGGWNDEIGGGTDGQEELLRGII
jgi:hypothetical protein